MGSASKQPTLSNDQQMMRTIDPDDQTGARSRASSVAKVHTEARHGLLNAEPISSNVSGHSVPDITTSEDTFGDGSSMPLDSLEHVEGRGDVVREESGTIASYANSDITGQPTNSIRQSSRHSTQPVLASDQVPLAATPSSRAATSSNTEGSKVEDSTASTEAGATTHTSAAIYNAAPTPSTSSEAASKKKLPHDPLSTQIVLPKQRSSHHQNRKAEVDDDPNHSEEEAAEDAEDADISKPRKRLPQAMASVDDTVRGRPSLAYQGLLLNADVGQLQPDLVGLSATADYLSQFCILDDATLHKYEQIFAAADRSGSGSLDTKELAAALRTACDKPLTDREMEFVLRVLDLLDATAPKGTKLKQSLNFRLFSVVAALTERVTKLDDKLRHTINTMEFNGLEAKLKTAKDLFYVNDSKREVSCERHSPCWLANHAVQGHITQEQLEVELQAGNLSEAHQNEVGSTTPGTAHFAHQGVCYRS
jgi:Ca2+-binding EF-hand superfamily protein